MKKAFGVIAAVVGMILLVAGVFVGIFVYKTSYAKTEIGTVISDDGTRKVVIYEIGEPDWPFGAAHCRAVLYDGGKRLDSCNIDIYNDGGWALDTNFAVQWNKDHAQIMTNGEEQEEESYYLYFDGHTE